MKLNRIVLGVATCFIPALVLTFVSACGPTSTRPSSSVYSKSDQASNSSEKSNAITDSSSTPTTSPAPQSTEYLRFFCVDDSAQDSVASFTAQINGVEPLGVRLFWNDPQGMDSLLLDVNQPRAISSAQGLTTLVFEASSSQSQSNSRDLYQRGVYFGQLDWKSNQPQAKLLGPLSSMAHSISQFFTDSGLTTRRQFAIDPGSQSILLPTADLSGFRVLNGDPSQDAPLKQTATLNCSPNSCWNPIFSMGRKQAVFTTVADGTHFSLKIFGWTTTDSIQSFTPKAFQPDADQWGAFFLSNGNKGRQPAIAWLESSSTEVDLVEYQPPQNTTGTNHRIKLFDLVNRQVIKEVGTFQSSTSPTIEVIVPLKQQLAPGKYYSQLELIEIDRDSLKIKNLDTLSIPLNDVSADGTIVDYTPTSFFFTDEDGVYATFADLTGSKLLYYSKANHIWSQINHLGCNQASWIRETNQ